MGSEMCIRDSAGLLFTMLPKGNLMPRFFTTQELQRLIYPGMTKSQLFLMFGGPEDTEIRSGGAVALWFQTTSAAATGAVDYVLSSFVVILTNDVVVHWAPGGWMTIGQ